MGPGVCSAHKRVHQAAWVPGVEPLGGGDVPLAAQPQRARVGAPPGHQEYSFKPTYRRQQTLNLKKCHIQIVFLAKTSNDFFLQTYPKR